MIRTHSPRPGPLTVRLLRMQYWYDRQSEPRRLLVGVALILFFGASLLYVLGITSHVMVSRIEEPADTDPVATMITEPAVQSAPTAPSSDPPTPTALPTPTPAVESGGQLIPPPDVPDVPVVWSPPRVAEPLPTTNKPRVVAATPTPVSRTAVPTSVTATTRAPGTLAPGTVTPGTVTSGTAGPTPARTPTPGNGAPSNGRTPTPALPAATAGRPSQQPLPTPTTQNPTKPTAPTPTRAPGQPGPTSKPR